MKYRGRLGAQLAPKLARRAAFAKLLGCAQTVRPLLQREPVGADR